MERKLCPVCQKELEEVEIPNKYGLKIRIDRCPSGCGFWFDRFELYQIDAKEAEELARGLPDRGFEEREKLLCPVCGIEMKKIRNQYFSDEIVIDYCMGCSGIWLDKEKLLKYKSLQEERARKTFKELLTAEDSNLSFPNSEGEALKSILKFLFKLYG